MNTVWHKGICGGLMALGLVHATWAAEQAQSPVLESAVQTGSWAGIGLWAGTAAFVVLGGLVVFLLMRSRSGTTAGVGAEAHSLPEQAVTPRGYSPKNVGNDASARPWESSLIGSSLGGAAIWSLPEDFDSEGFLAASKENFITLQSAWDQSDIARLRSMMTDAMLDQIKSQLAAREASSGGATNTTEVVLLEARLLGIEEQEAEYTASVEFSGMLREDPSAGPNPFREVWNITRPKVGSGGWLVAGVQALQ